MVAVGPYLFTHFFIMPMPLILVGQHLGKEDMCMNAVEIIFLAEILSNLHGICRSCNELYAGDDMYRFHQG